MIQDAYFSLLSHTKQLLLVTFSDTTAGIGASFRTDAQTAADGGGGRTDRRGSRNSYLDLNLHLMRALLWSPHKKTCSLWMASKLCCADNSLMGGIPL